MEDEKRLVRYAVDHLEGAFTKNALVGAGLIRPYDYDLLTARWSADGKLVKEHRGDRRVQQWWLTPKIMAEVGIDKAV